MTNNSSLYPLINNYLEFYCSNNSHTARAKRLDLSSFIQFIQKLNSYSKPEKIKLSDWTQSNLNRYIENLLDKGESPATVSRRLATLKHLGRILAENNSTLINPARNIKPPKVRPEKPVYLKDMEVKAIRKKAQSIKKTKKSFNAERNALIFDLLLETGLRADEVRNLKLVQLDNNYEWFKAVRTKGRKYRNVYIPSTIREKLKNYLSLREAKLKKLWPTISKKEAKALPLFISGYSAKAGNLDSFYMGAKTIWRAINEFSEKTPLHPHLLRHSYAMELLDSSKDLRLVSQALGHSDLKVTMRYTERSDQEVAKAIEKSKKTKKA